MIQTPVLDLEMRTSKDTTFSANPVYNSSKKSPKAPSNWRDRLEVQRDSDTLSLVDLFIGDEGAYEIAKFLKYNKDYVALHLRGNNISAAGFEAICQALKGSTRMKVVSAEWNNIGSDISGLVALQQTLKANSPIEVVDLKNNRIGFNCVRIINDIIRDSTSLKKLDLRWNEVGEEGGQQILNTLRQTRKKIGIDLNGNRLGEETLAQINDPFSDGVTYRSHTEVSNRVRTGESPPKEELFQHRSPQFTAGGEAPSYSTVPQQKYSTNISKNYEQSFGGTQVYGTRTTNTANYQSNIDVSPPSRHLVELEKRAYNPKTPSYSEYEGGSKRTYSTKSITPVAEYEKKAGTTTGLSSQNYTPSQSRTQYARQEIGQTTADRGSRTANVDRYSPTRRSYVTAGTHHIETTTTHLKSSDVQHDINRRSENRTLAAQLLRERDEELTLKQKYLPKQNTPQATTKTAGGATDVRHSESHSHHTQSHTKRSAINTNEISEADAQHLKVGKLISGLEQSLEKEQGRANEFEEKLRAVLSEFEMESSLRQELERKYSHIIEDLKRSDIQIHDMRMDFEAVSGENSELRNEVNVLRHENQRLEEYNKSKLIEIEDRYKHQLRAVEAQNQELREDIEGIQRELNGQIVDLKRDFENKRRKYEAQVDDFGKLNDELSTELATQMEHVEKLKIDHEHNLRRTIEKVKDEEVHRAQQVIRSLEEELRSSKATNEVLTRKNEEMLKDLKNYEKQIREQHIQFANELSRTGGEIDRSRSDLAQANTTIQKQHSEIMSRDATIKNLEGEVERMRTEIQRLADMQVVQIDNFKREYENERRRFEDNERQMVLRVEETERRLAESQQETIKITREYERLVDIMQGNVSRVIQDTFSLHKSSTEVRHFDVNKISTPAKTYGATTDISTSSRYYGGGGGNLDRKYF